MQHARTIALILVAAIACLAADHKAPAAASTLGFDKLKSLVGAWKGTYSGADAAGVQVTNTFKVVSAGSAVMLVSGEGTNDEMITMFHPAGADLMVTHYCSIQNQPRMKLLPSSDPNKLVFEFLDVANVSDPKMEHMKRLVITILSPDHHTQEWTSEQAGKATTGKFDFHRVKT